jgi:hypothetical protein
MAINDHKWSMKDTASQQMAPVPAGVLHVGTYIPKSGIALQLCYNPGKDAPLHKPRPKRLHEKSAAFWVRRDVKTADSTANWHSGLKVGVFLFPDRSLSRTRSICAVQPDSL